MQKMDIDELEISTIHEQLREILQQIYVQDYENAVFEIRKTRRQLEHIEVLLRNAIK